MVILNAMYPDHPNLLPSYFKKVDHLPEKYVTKPFYSREGSNITVYDSSVEVLSTDGEYGEEGLIYQEYAAIPSFDGNHPVIGSWVIDGVSAGIGIREDKTLITGNFSRFIPHIFK